MSQQYYYKLVRPFESNNVYLASSLMSGAGKCFKEVLRAMPDTTEFSIIDINSNEVFDFNINPPPISQELLQAKLESNVSLEDIKELRDKINNLERRILKLEGVKGSSEDNVILLGGDNNKSINNSVNNNINTLSQVNSIKMNNNRNLSNKLNNGQDVNVDLARQLMR